MNIKKTLNAIENHLAKHRGVGHTTVMLRGVENGGNCIVVSVDKAHAMILRDMTPKSCVVKSIADPEGFITAPPLPLVMDNWSLHELCREARLKIERLEAQIEKIQKEAAKQ